MFNLINYRIGAFDGDKKIMVAPVCTMLLLTVLLLGGCRPMVNGGINHMTFSWTHLSKVPSITINIISQHGIYGIPIIISAFTITSVNYVC